MQTKSGISLIVLVITIIVMIILAAAIIISLNNTGIIGNANKAVDDTNLNQIKEMAQIAHLEGVHKGLSEEELKTYVMDYLKKSGFTNLDKFDIKVTKDSVTVTKKSNAETIDVNFNGYNYGTWTNKNITITLSYKDAQKYQYSNDNKNWVDCNETLTITSDQEKIYYFSATTKDGKTIKTEGYEIKKDTVAPKFEVSVDASYKWTITDLVEQGSGVETVQISCVDSSGNEVIDYTGKQMQGSLKDTTFIQEIKAVVIDKAGNERRRFASIIKTSMSEKTSIDKIGEGYESYYKLSNTYEEDYPEEILEMFKSRDYTNINKYVSDGNKYTLLSNFYELSAISGGIRNAEGEFDVKIVYKDLKTSTKNISIMYYDIDMNMLNVIEPLDINYDTKTLTLSLPTVPTAFAFVAKQ